MIRSFIIGIVLSALASCSSGERLPGHVYYRLSSNPTTLDPALIVDVTGGTIAAKLFSGLVKLGDAMKVVPDVAQRWEISGGGRIYRFHLRGDAFFPNGRRITATDFKYSFERVLDPKTKSPNTWVFDKIAGAKEFSKGLAKDVSGIRVINDDTLEIRLAERFSPFLSLMTMTAAYAVPREEVQRLGPDFSGSPVGCGPFSLKEWLPNRHLILERSVSYFGEKARAKGIVYRVIPEDLTALAEFELGNLDIIGVPASAYSKYKSSAKWRGLMSSAEGPNTYYLGMNCSKPPFDDPAIRRAVSMAIDRARILSTLYEERGRLARGPVPDIMRTWKEPDILNFNPAEAKKIISGYGGVKAEFFITADQEVVDMAEVFQAHLKDAGLDVRIRQLEWSAYKEAVNKGEADMFYLSWWADYPDPENFLFPLFHSSNIGPAGNRARYSNPAVDALIEKGKGAGSIRERDRAYSEAERIIVHDAPWVFLWHRTDYAVRQAGVRGYRMHPIYSMDKGTEVYLSD